jgi:hypothetical protein
MKRMLGTQTIASLPSAAAIGVLVLACAGFGAPVQASAAVVTYDVNMNFNPTQAEAPPGAGSVGTITGTVTFDTTANAILGVNLTESTNDGLANIGGGFGSPTYTTITYTQFEPDVITFFGSPDSLATSSVRTFQSNNVPYLFLSFQTPNTVFDGTLIGPGFQFDFPEAGGNVIAGNFDSITSETRYLYGDVMIQAAVTGPGASGVPEPATWMMMVIGAGAMGGALRRRHAVAVV